MGYFFANDTKKEYWNNWAKIENAIIPNSISAVINSSNKITFLLDRLAVDRPPSSMIYRKYRIDSINIPVFYRFPGKPATTRRKYLLTTPNTYN